MKLINRDRPKNVAKLKDPKPNFTWSISALPERSSTILATTRKSWKHLRGKWWRRVCWEFNKRYLKRISSITAKSRHNRYYTAGQVKQGLGSVEKPKGRVTCTRSWSWAARRQTMADWLARWPTTGEQCRPQPEIRAVWPVGVYQLREGFWRTFQL